MEMKPTISLYLEYCMSKELRSKSMRAYEQTLKLFAVWLEEEAEITRVEDVKDATIRKYILALQMRGKYTASSNKQSDKINYPHHRTDCGEKISNTTINNYLRNIRGFFGWLVEIEYLEKNPMRRIRLLPSKRTAKEYLEDSEVKALIAVMDREKFSEHRDLMVMMLMLDSGMRLGETLTIETEQLDLFNRTVYLPAEKTKGRKARTVFFSHRMARELRRWMKDKERSCDSRLLFPVMRTGEALCVRNYEANFRKYLKRTTIGKQISPHTFRNNFAKRCLMSGMDIYTLSRILGHSSVKVTEQAYLDVTDRELRGKYQAFSPMESIYRAK